MSKVKHIVLLKFKEGTTEEQTAKFFDDLLDLSESVPGIDDYVSGTNCSAEGLNQGMTHGFIMTFTDRRGPRRLYGPSRTRKVQDHGDDDRRKPADL